MDTISPAVTRSVSASRRNATVRNSASPIAHAVHQRLPLARAGATPASFSRTGLAHHKVGAVVNFVVAATYQFWYIGSRGEREATAGLLLRAAVRSGAGSRMAQGPRSRRSEGHRGGHQGRGVFLADRDAALPSARQGALGGAQRPHARPDCPRAVHASMTAAWCCCTRSSRRRRRRPTRIGIWPRNE